jgi:hypothetical protein
MSFLLGKKLILHILAMEVIIPFGCFLPVTGSDFDL